MPPVSTRDPCEILGPSSARCNSTYFEIAMSECRTPATALASGRQGPAAQRQLATRPADPPQLHLGPARGRRRAQGLVDSRSRPWSSRRARGRSAVGGGDREHGQGALHRREVGHGRPRRRWRRPGRVARATRGGDREPGGGGAGAAIASRASLRHLAGASLAPGSHPLERPEPASESANLKSVFTPLPLPRGCHATRADQGFRGTNRDSILTQACVVTAGSRDG